MPVLDGWGFLIERNRDLRLAQIPVVIMSGSRAVADKAKEAGAVAFLPKPFDPRDLLPAISQFMRRLESLINQIADRKLEQRSTYGPCAKRFIAALVENKSRNPRSI